MMLIGGHTLIRVCFGWQYECAHSYECTLLQQHRTVHKHTTHNTTQHTAHSTHTAPRTQHNTQHTTHKEEKTNPESVHFQGPCGPQQTCDKPTGCQTDPSANPPLMDPKIDFPKVSYRFDVGGETPHPYVKHTHAPKIIQKKKSKIIKKLKLN
jgi:hypothetical protein